MRTAKEIKKHIESLGWQEVDREALIQEILDEAIAHGMTISAEICKARETESDLTVEATRCKQIILTERDNKVWRKE